MSPIDAQGLRYYPVDGGRSSGRVCENSFPEAVPATNSSRVCAPRYSSIALSPSSQASCRTQGALSPQARFSMMQWNTPKRPSTASAASRSVISSAARAGSLRRDLVRSRPAPSGRAWPGYAPASDAGRGPQTRSSSPSSAPRTRQGRQEPSRHTAPRCCAPTSSLTGSSQETLSPLGTQDI